MDALAGDITLPKKQSTLFSEKLIDIANILSIWGDLKTFRDAGLLFLFMNMS